MKVIFVYMVIIAMLFFVGAAYCQQYSVIDLGTDLYVSINELGQLAGGNLDAYIWSNGQATLITTNAYTQEINNNGQVVGYSNSKAFVYQGGTLTTLELPVEYKTSTAFAINNCGDVVGQVNNQWALWDDGSFTNLSIAGTAVGINDLGQIIGYNGGNGYLWDNDVLTNLGSLGGGETLPYAINNYRQLVGSSCLDVGTDFVREHAFLWDNGVMIDLGTISGRSIAYGINDLGQVVGFSDGGAFIWEDGEMLNLNDLIIGGEGIQIDMALDINNNGQIIACGWVDAEERSHAYLLTSIPEPGMMVLVGLGIMMVRRTHKL